MAHEPIFEPSLGSTNLYQYEVLEMPNLQQPKIYLIEGWVTVLRFECYGLFMFDYENLGQNLSENV